MTDIVERLYNDAHQFNYGVGAKLEEAAAEIERLRADNARLRVALTRITRTGGGAVAIKFIHDIARAALEGKDD